MKGMASMILNRDLFCDDYYNDSLTDVINPRFWISYEDNLKSNLPYVFAEKIHGKNGE